MASYNEIDGVPSHANRWLLRDVLRGEWGFEGYVVSDYYAIRELAERPELYGHHVAARRQRGGPARGAGRREHRAARARLLSRTSSSWCAKGRSPSRELDELVAPMLALQVPARPVRRSVRRPRSGRADRRLRRRIASWRSKPRAKTITLLKNDGDRCRSIRTQLKTIAVIGPNADRELLGGYSGKPKHCSTVLEGIRQRVGADRRGAVPRGLQDHHRRLLAAGRRDAERSRRRPPQRSPRPSHVAAARRRGRARRRRQRANLARSVDGQPPGRPHEPRHGRPAGRAGRRDRRDRQTDRRPGVQRPAAVDPQSRRKRPPRSSSAGTSGRKPAGPWPTCCSATSIPAASCRSPSRGRWATCRRITTTSRRPAAATCSTTVAALPVRLRPELHDVQVQSAAAGTKPTSAATKRRACSVDVTNTGARRAATRSCSSTSATW